MYIASDGDVRNPVDQHLGIATHEELYIIRMYGASIVRFVRRWGYFMRVEGKVANVTLK